jgi:hypothetical protein
MKGKACFGVILTVTLLLCGCATMEGLPQGAVLVAEYQGSFTGNFFWGSMGIKVYDAPGGSRPVIGWFEQEAEPGSMIFFRGDVQGLRFQGQFTMADANISGELSADSRSLSGTYNFTAPPIDHGTWNSKKK